MSTAIRDVNHFAQTQAGQTRKAIKYLADPKPMSDEEFHAAFWTILPDTQPTTPSTKEWSLPMSGLDVGQKLRNALTLTRLAQQTKSPEMLIQHLAGVERELELVLREEPNGEAQAG